MSKNLTSRTVTCIQEIEELLGSMELLGYRSVEGQKTRRARRICSSFLLIPRTTTLDC